MLFCGPRLLLCGPYYTVTIILYDRRNYARGMQIVPIYIGEILCGGTQNKKLDKIVYHIKRFCMRYAKYLA